MIKCCEHSNVWNTFMKDRVIRECHSCHRKIVLIRCIKNKYNYIEMTI